MLEFLNNKKGEATPDVTATVAKLQAQLAGEEPEGVGTQ